MNSPQDNTHGSALRFGDAPNTSELSALRKRYGAHSVMVLQLEVEALADRHAQEWHWMATNLRNMGGGSVGERRPIAEKLIWGVWRSGGYHGTVQPNSGISRQSP